MHRVYHNATLTIGASAATNGTQGLINRRKLHKFTHTTSHGDNLTVCVRQHGNHSWADNPNGGTYTDDLPLRTRAWCLQEELLSSRFVYFTPDEIAYCCRTGTNCECQPTFHFQGRSNNDTKSWQGLMRNYMRRNITFNHDRLPAISSLVQSDGRDTQLYLAGLWKSNMPKDLLWAYHGSSHRSPISEVPLSAPPSWTWVSVSGESLAWLDYTRSEDIQAEVLEAVAYPSTSDPTGLVSGGHVTLRGTLLPLESEWRKVTTEWTIAGVPVWEVNGQLERQLPVAKDWSKEGTCCCTLDEVDLAKPPVVGGSFGAPTYLFVVSRDDGPKGRVFYGLLIQRYTDSGRQARGTSATQAEESKWVRVGLGELQVDPHIESFSSEFTTTVTII
jgi:hypothetical protein